MSIEFTCPHCGRRHRVRDGFAGRVVICGESRRQVLVPAPVREASESCPRPPLHQTAMQAPKSAPHAEGSLDVFLESLAQEESSTAEPRTRPARDEPVDDTPSARLPAPRQSEGLVLLLRGLAFALSIPVGALVAGVIAATMSPSNPAIPTGLFVGSCYLSYNVLKSTFGVE